MDASFGFETTHWTSIIQASGDGTERSDEAFEKLCRVYWYPIFAYTRSRGVSESEAMDLTQAFFKQLLEKGFSIRAGAERGRFRSYLLQCHQNFIATEKRRAKAVKRGGDIAWISLDLNELNGLTAEELEGGATPAQLYEKKWAETLLLRVLERLEKEYRLAGKLERYSLLKPWLMNESQAMAQKDIAETLGVSQTTVRTAIFRMRETFGELLRSEVLRIVEDPADVDDEIRHLLTLWG